MVKKIYRALNQMSNFKQGWKSKPFFTDGKGENKRMLKMEVEKNNKAWNKFSREKDRKGYIVHLHKIVRVK